MTEPIYNRYHSRTYWLVIGVILISTGLVWFGKIEGAAWVTVALAVVSAWQLRRAHDNKLHAENGK